MARKAIPLDYGLEFNPAMGVMSRACPACFEAYEQWRGLGTTTTTTTRSTMKAGALGSISDSSATTNSGKDGLLSSHNTRKSEGRLGQTGNSSSETLGREG
ncbi:hypothetical protein BGX34_010175 [Mortierella sp. NVP85]|nr:hypothetical protein BGX34_010175 [Mortierella sp. NVP85]